MPVHGHSFYSHQGRFYDLAGRPCDVAQYDGQTFFVKTIGGSEGIGADIICFRPPGDRRAEDLLYQELLVPHRALAAISPVRAMPTLRVNSYFTKGGRVEILSALIKFAGPGAVADNMAAGAIGVGIDPLEGRLHAEGVSKQGRRTSEGRAITAHPISGIPFEGFQVPCWHECVALLDRLHPLFPNLRAIGWDLAVTEAGPVVIEGNSVGALLFEQVFSRPFFGTTYVQENLGELRGRPLPCVDGEGALLLADNVRL
ncbi:MAG: hypothetical protein M5U12_18125 [Verrucomicrobia bacterium]|nr:hypothetical protein [Verrucomicrobiota bacterium]